MLPLARSGDTNAYHATMAEVATYANASVSSGAYGNVGRNKLHNALFNVQQRGAGSWTVSGYTADRWQGWINLDTTTFAVSVIGDTGRTQIGDEAATQALTANVTGNSGAGAYSFVVQKIEGVRRLAGKTVIVSFWAWATAGTPKVGIALNQHFGSGGSPSADANGTGQSVTLSTTATRYSLTFSLPSSAGKTLGTNGDDYTQFNVWLSAGSNFTSGSGGIGVQTAVFNFWGVQLEIGNTATPLEKLDPRLDLANCQRFYQVGNISLQGYANASATAASGHPFPVAMRATPTLTAAWSNTNINSPTIGGMSAGYYQYYGNVGTSGQFALGGTFTASADL